MISLDSLTDHIPVQQELFKEPLHLTQHTLWIRQDQLLLNAILGILGSLSPIIMSFIAQAQTSQEAWTILANTYAKPSRGRIKQVKNQFKQITKGSMGVSEFLQTIKARADELAILDAPVDIEDL